MVDPVSLVSAVSTSGPVLGALVVHAMWVNGQYKDIKDRITKLEGNVSSKLDNGIRTDMGSLDRRLSTIEGHLSALPRRKTDDE